DRPVLAGTDRTDAAEYSATRAGHGRPPGAVPADGQGVPRGHRRKWARRLRGPRTDRECVVATPSGNGGQVSAVGVFRALHRPPRRPVAVDDERVVRNAVRANGPDVAAGDGVHTGELGIRGLARTRIWDQLPRLAARGVRYE